MLLKMENVSGLTLKYVFLFTLHRPVVIQYVEYTQCSHTQITSLTQN